MQNSLDIKCKKLIYTAYTNFHIHYYAASMTVVFAGHELQNVTQRGGFKVLNACKKMLIWSHF